MPRLQGKTALITGSAQGIGQAIAALFIKEGAQVILSDIDDEKGKAAALALNADYLTLDVANEAHWQQAVTYIEQNYQTLDILVNNAGITGFIETQGSHDPENLDLASWHQVHHVNLDGVALGCKYGISLLKHSRAASIVNISSRSGIVGIPMAASYASSKAAVRNHSKSVALYCAQQHYNIRCNSIHPAAIYTPMWDFMLGDGTQRELAIKAIEKDIPLKRMGDVDDVAYAALYLASDEAKYVTGIELNIDGGILAGAVAAPD